MYNEISQHHTDYANRPRVVTILSRITLAIVLCLAMFFVAAPATMAQGPAINAQSSTVANPASYLPLDASYARVTYNAPVYASVDAIRANNPFTYHGGNGAWVSAYRDTQVGGQSYYWVGWDWNTYGWMPADALSFSAPLSHLRGVDLRERPGERLAMVYGTALNVRSQPGVISPATRIGALQPYDVVSVLEERNVNGAVWYRIGNGQWIHSGYVRNFIPGTRPEGVGANAKWVEVNLSEQVVIAHEGDTPVYATLTSTGISGFETVTGLYYIYVKHRTAPMRWLNIDNPYSLADVPYTMYFHQGYGLHGTYWHDNFGTVQSHGCVNLSPYDSLWFFNWTGPNLPEGNRSVWASENNLGTWVYVHY
ncbi:MAG: L,D-transpeptidase family protein [Chloroflexota bacterium]|nr:L,D-transpeptidase family protein [Chloroflexota bacterium]